MLLANPYCSCLNSYIKSVNNSLNDNVNTQYKSYDKEKDDFIVFSCFDLKSDVKLSEDIFFKEITYNGVLEFAFNKKTNEVLVNRVPYVNYANVQLPVFTSNIASIIVDLLKKYIPHDEIKIKFDNEFTLLAEDKEVVNVIPDIINTSNHKLLMCMLDNIKKEENKVMAETMRYKEKQEKLRRNQERAITKRRQIYGLDFKDFASIDDFITELSNKMSELLLAKIRKSERHLKLNEKKYKAILRDKLDQEAECYDKADYSVKCLLLTYLRAVEYEYEEDDQIGNIKEVYDYFENGKYTDAPQEIIDKVLDYILEGDLCCENGALKLYKQALEDEDLSEYKEIIHGENLFVDYNDLVYMIFRTKYYEGRNPLYSYGTVFSLADCEVKRDSLTAINLLIQIDKLRENIKYYKSLLNNPTNMALRIYRNSTLWGTLMQQPFWQRIYKDRHRGSNELFSLLMIKPGVTKVNLNYMIKFIDGEIYKDDMHKKCYTSDELCFFDRFMVTIPKSLDIQDINMIIDYVYKHGRLLNFVCENTDTAIIIKRVLINKAIEALKRGEKYFKDWCFVNVDPNYYDSFLVDAPNNKVFWHRYDFSSEYRYKRKELLSLDEQFDMACLHLSKNHIEKIQYQLLDELMFGGYSENLDSIEVIQSYRDLLNKHSESYELQLKESEEKRKMKTKILVKYSGRNHKGRYYGKKYISKWVNWPEGNS